jgi:hypothetical protein
VRLFAGGENGWCREATIWSVVLIAVECGGSGGKKVIPLPVFRADAD